MSEIDEASNADTCQNCGIFTIFLTR